MATILNGAKMPSDLQKAFSELYLHEPKNTKVLADYRNLVFSDKSRIEKFEWIDFNNIGVVFALQKLTEKFLLVIGSDPESLPAFVDREVIASKFIKGEIIQLEQLISRYRETFQIKYITKKIIENKEVQTVWIYLGLNHVFKVISCIKAFLKAQGISAKYLLDANLSDRYQKICGERIDEIPMQLGLD